MQTKMLVHGIETKVQGIEGFIPVYATKEEAEEAVGDKREILPMKIPDKD